MLVCKVYIIAKLNEMKNKTKQNNILNRSLSNTVVNLCRHHIICDYG
ncbi:hypothetical protein DOY81_006722, partial [Sarcophaga bullata]